MKEKTGNQIIQDYGQTVLPDVYIRILQEHPYIPQSDQCIRNIINKHCVDDFVHRSILDLGCGPGRLSFNLGHKNCHVSGFDISDSFIEYAKRISSDKNNNYANFYFKDFASESLYEFEKSFDVILMQGVMHHIHDNDRMLFIEKCHDLLKEDGILIIGDEFIANYLNEHDRSFTVCAFYMHIIAEAKKGGFDELAEEEAKNLIDDVLSGTEFAGYGDKEIFEFIYFHARAFNENFYSGNLKETLGGISFGTNVSIVKDKVLEKAKELEQVHAKNFNRGDKKVSLIDFSTWVTSYGFNMRETYKFGPVDQLGGMGVIVFVKK